MPKLSLFAISNTVNIGLWSIEETVDEMLDTYPFLNVYTSEMDARFKSESRRREFLAVRALLNMMDGESKIRYREDSSPYIDGKYCSISHTKGYAALMISTSAPVGIDIEYRSDRVNKIVDKFIRDDEVAVDTVSQLIHWSSKESLYKLFHEDHLDYFDMRLLPFHDSCEGTLIAENLKKKIRQNIFYRVTDDYVLTYCSM